MSKQFIGGDLEKVDVSKLPNSIRKIVEEINNFRAECKNFYQHVHDRYSDQPRHDHYDRYDKTASIDD